jgi:hypothetical protein
MYKIFSKSVVAVVFQNVFYLEMHQNNFFLFLKNYFWYQPIKIIWKHQKYINLKQRKKNQIFKKHFWNAKTNKVLRNSVKKACKNFFIKTAFQTQFFSRPRNTKHSLVCYQTSCCVCSTTNIKANEKQTRPILILKMKILKKN